MFTKTSTIEGNKEYNIENKKKNILELISWDVRVNKGFANRQALVHCLLTLMS